MGQAWILSWEEAARSGARICGGKGWNLGRLHRYGFAVPAGGVLIADAYRQFLAAPALGCLCESLAAVPAMQCTDAEVIDRLDRLRSALAEREFSDEVRQAVAAWLAEHRRNETPLAVRSSATAEDSATASFAGIHRSCLHCMGLEEVLDGIRACYASLWTPAALAYRRHQNLSDAEAACAVVLCAMIGPARAGLNQISGVAFSCDPRTGWRDRIHLGAVPGLGDALVSGREQPEEITVRITRGHLRIIERGGRAAPVLDDAQALELARLTWRVHWALGNGQEPQDLEWSHDGRRFWLLQARPVTGLPPATHPDLAGQPVYWSSANVKEVVPGIPSTLTWSVLQPALWDILYAVQLAVGYRLPPGLEMIRRHAGRLYFDLSALQYIFYDSFGGSPAVLNDLLGGHQPLIDVPPGSAFLSRRGLHRLRNRVRLARIMLTVPGRLSAFLPSAATIIRRAKALDVARQTPAQLLEWLYRVGDRSRPIGRLAQLINASAGGWYTALQTILRWQVGARGPVLAAGLMAGSDQVTTAAHGYRLFDLAALARRDHAALAYFERTPFDPHSWRRLPADSLFRRAFEHFLAEFGHRTVYEIEVANPRWNEDPTFLLEQVRFLLAHPPPRHPRDAARRTRAAAEAELNRRMHLLRPVVRWLAHRMRRGTALRERAKSLMVALWEPMRYLILEAGRRLTAAGALEQVEDVFHLSYPDLESYLRGEWDGQGARALVADRREQLAAWQSETPPDVFVQDSAKFSAHRPRDAADLVSAPDADTWTGLALSSGRAVGPARILRHPSEASRLRPGDVLIAPSTDPGWTPLFLRAAALVMEVGGYLSHGAIVAREYGIPAVSNLPGILDAVREGEPLVVDGDTGRVFRTL